MYGNVQVKGEYGVIWDLDGVLIDTGEYHRQSWKDLGAEECLEMTDELFFSTFGMQNYQIIPMLTDRKLDDAEIARLGEKKEQRYRELIAGSLKLLDGVKELLEDLKAGGFLMAVGSSTPRKNLEFMLDHLPVDDYFDDYVCGEDVQAGKPAPDTFLMAAEKLGLDPMRCVVIEDAPAGVKAGKAGGMKVIAVTNTVTADLLGNADIVVDSLCEVSSKDICRILKI